MNFQEILTALKAHYDPIFETISDSGDIYDSGIYMEGSETAVNLFADKDDKEIPGIGKVVDIDKGSVDYEHAYRIKFFPEHGVYVKIVGGVSSFAERDDLLFYDDDWSDLKEVSPKQVTTTIYE